MALTGQIGEIFNNANSNKKIYKMPFIPSKRNMAIKELRLKIAEAIQEYENQRFSIVQQVGHDVNKGTTTIVPDLYLHLNMETDNGY